MTEEFTLEEFSRAKREKLLDYKIYAKNFYHSSKTLNTVRPQLRQPELLATVPVDALMGATRGLAKEAIDHLTNIYSGGHSLDDLRSLYPVVVECWEAASQYHKAFHSSEEGKGSLVATLPLLGHGFHQANRLVTFGILLGRTDLIGRLVPLIDYNNPGRDGMLERMLAPFISGRGDPPDECIRHLPYFKTLKVFKAMREDRPRLMAKYLAEWYHASRREPYYDSHTRGVAFRGYWSWESAAITVLLDIDDTSYRDAFFYPRDLVEYARDLKDQQALNPPSPDSAKLRVAGGATCPQTGYWSTPAKQGSRQLFEAGTIMPIFPHSEYGSTIWQWDLMQ